jgi:hypothetical protein
MSFCSFLTFPFQWVTEIEIIERIARVLVDRKHLASRERNWWLQNLPESSALISAQPASR